LFGAIDEWPRKPNGPRLEPADEARIDAAVRDQEAITDRDHLAESIDGDGDQNLSIMAGDELVGEIEL
jgi:hypothetical protein